MMFVKAIVNTVKAYGLDGRSLLHLIQSLRIALGAYRSSDRPTFINISILPDFSKIIPDAVGHTPWLGSNGFSLSDASSFAEHLNFIDVM